MTKPLFFILGTIAVFFVSCRSKSNIAGSYQSNFAVNGFFGTNINLKADSTFGYRMRGDMMFDTSKGHYKFDNKYLILFHEPFKPDTSEYEKHGKYAVFLLHTL